MRKILELEGLKTYDVEIKKLISSEDAKSIKRITHDAVNRTINFFKTETPSEPDTPYISIKLPEDVDISGLLEKIKSGIVGNVVSVGENGTVVDSGIPVSKLSTKDELKNVEDKIGNIGSLTTTQKSNVVDAVNELKGSIDTTNTNKQISIETTVTTEGALKSYTIKQGENVAGVIDIPKDLVVTEGSVIVDPDGQPKGTYIKLVIANQVEPLYINVGKLVDIYFAKGNAQQVQISIDTVTREISASIVAGSIGTTELANSSVTSEKIADSSVAYSKLGKDVTDKIQNLETSIEAIKPITTEEIQGLFKSV